MADEKRVKLTKEDIEGLKSLHEKDRLNMYDVQKAIKLLVKAVLEQKTGGSK